MIDEGLRARRHPLLSFRDEPAGRRAYVNGGPDVWEVIEGLVGGDVAPTDRITRAAEVFGLRRELVEAALAYYAEFTENARDFDRVVRSWSLTGEHHVGVVFTSPRRYHRGSHAYLANLITALEKWPRGRRHI